MQPESPTTTMESKSKGDGSRRDKGERKKDKKKHRSTVAPTEEITQTINEVIPSPEPEPQTETRAPKEKNHPKKDKKSKRDRNRERQTLTSDPAEVERRENRKTVKEESRNRGNNAERQSRENTGRNSNTEGGSESRRTDEDTLREPQDGLNGSTIDECRSDRDCSQGKWLIKA